jgi:hypothetical protein
MTCDPKLSEVYIIVEIPNFVLYSLTDFKTWFAISKKAK